MLGVLTRGGRTHVANSRGVSALQLRRPLVRRHIQKRQHPPNPRILLDLFESDRQGRGLRLFPPPARCHRSPPASPAAAAPGSGSPRAPSISDRSPAETGGDVPLSLRCCPSGSAAAPQHCAAPQYRLMLRELSSSSASGGRPSPAE